MRQVLLPPFKTTASTRRGYLLPCCFPFGTFLSKDCPNLPIFLPINLSLLCSKLFFVLLLAAAGMNLAYGQSTLYTPREVKIAYKKGTRSPDGRPGPNYWQNHGRYEITIDAAPPDRLIRGTEKITYFNNSPDTLRIIVFRLTVNIHKPGAVRLGQRRFHLSQPRRTYRQLCGKRTATSLAGIRNMTAPGDSSGSRRPSRPMIPSGSISAGIISPR